MISQPQLQFRQYRAETVKHSHQGIWQFVLGAQGEMELEIGRDHGRILSGNMVIIPPDYEHSFSAYGHNKQLIIELPSAFYSLENSDSLWQPLSNATRAYIKWMLDYPEVALHNSACTQLLLAQLHPIEQRYCQLEQKLYHTLIHHLDDDWSVAEMAAACAVSVSTLQRKLYTSSRLTPLAYLTKLRMELAQSLLKNTSKSLVDIALSCGYSSQSALTYAFRRHFNITPAALRRKK